jgi:hypothetical protein
MPNGDIKEKALPGIPDSHTLYEPTPDLSNEVGGLLIVSK